MTHIYDEKARHGNLDGDDWVPCDSFGVEPIKNKQNHFSNNRLSKKVRKK